MTQTNLFVDGYRLIDGTELNDALATPTWSVEQSLAATVGGTLSTSAKIEFTVTQITGSVAGAAITLPQALPGRILVIDNTSPNYVVVFAEGGSTVDGIPGDIGGTIDGSFVSIYGAVGVNEWKTLSSYPTGGSAGNPILVVDSIADLRNIIGPPGAQAFVRGYYTIGDGGGGQYYAATGAFVDNGGSIIVPTAGVGVNVWLLMTPFMISAKQFGAKGDGVITNGAPPWDMTGTDDSVALSNLYATSPQSVYYPDGLYIVDGNFNRLNIPHYGTGRWGVKLASGKYQQVFVDSIITHDISTVYVSNAGSDTANHGLSDLFPFATPQRAFDSLPYTINTRQLIQLAAGLYDTSSRPASSMPRAAIFYPQGKNIAQRTDAPGGNAYGMVTLAGSGTATTIIKVNPTAGYHYGIYVTRVELAIRDLSVLPDASSPKSDVLITAHRGAYVHCSNVTINGITGTDPLDPTHNIGLANASVAETGGIIETINCIFIGADYSLNPLTGLYTAVAYALTVYPMCVGSIASPNAGVGSIGAIYVAGYVNVAAGMTVNNPVQHVLVGNNGTFVVTGLYNAATLTVYPVPVLGNVTTYPGATFACSAVDLYSDVQAYLSSLDFTLTGWDKTLLVSGGDVRLRTSNSYRNGKIPARSDVAIPLVLIEGAQLTADPDCNIIANTGLPLGPDYGNQRVEVLANNSVIPLTLYGNPSSISLVAVGGNWTGCTLSNVITVGTTVTARPPGDGQILHINSGTPANTIQLVSGTTAVIPGGAIVLGTAAGVGAHSGCSFVWNAAIAKWVMVAVSLQFP